MLLYWSTRLLRVALASASTTGRAAFLPKNSWPEAAEVPPIVPIVAEAASFEVGDGQRTVLRQRGLEVVRSQRRVEVVQRLDVAGAGATEGDVGRDAAASGADDSVRPLSCRRAGAAGLADAAVRPSAGERAGIRRGDAEVAGGAGVQTDSAVRHRRQRGRTRQRVDLASNWVTLSVTLIWLLPEAPDGLNVMFWPLTVMVSPTANAEVSALLEVLAAPESVVDPESCTEPPVRAIDRTSQAELGQRRGVRAGEADIGAGAGGQVDLAGQRCSIRRSPD